MKTHEIKNNQAEIRQKKKELYIDAIMYIGVPQNEDIKALASVEVIEWSGDQHNGWFEWARPQLVTQSLADLKWLYERIKSSQEVINDTK